MNVWSWSEIDRALYQMLDGVMSYGRVAEIIFVGQAGDVF